MGGGAGGRLGPKDFLSRLARSDVGWRAWWSVGAKGYHVTPVRVGGRAVAMVVK